MMILMILSGYGVMRYTYTVTPLCPSTNVGQILYIDRENRALLQNQNQRFLVYSEDLMNYHSGDWVYFEGELAVIEQPLNIGDFNYAKFLYAMKISGVIYADSIEYIDSSFHVYQFREFVSDYIEHAFNDSKTYLRMFVLAENHTLEPTLKQKASSLGIAHLFAISGLHIGLIAFGLNQCLKFLRLPENLRIVFVSSMLIGYMLMTSFAPSVVRAGGLYTLLVINKKMKLQFTAFDLTALLAIAMLIVRPYYYVRVGFLLSFIISLGLILSQKQLAKGNWLIQMLKVSSLAFIFSLPIVSGFNYGVNPLTILFNIVFVSYTMFMLLPLIYMTFLVPFIEPILLIILDYFEAMVALTYNYFNWRIRLYFDHPVKILVYYGLISFCLASNHRAKKLIFGFIVVGYLTMLHMTPYLINYQRIVFFHVAGDSTLIQDRFNRCNILIDTGDIDRYESLNHHLHRLHVTHLDYVIISHFHQDHYGGYEALTQSFEIHKTITNNHQLNYQDRWIECGDILFFIYPLEAPHLSENNRSLVMRLLLEEESILFVGDAEREREITLLEYDLASDILKVGHHGSITSSNDFFIDHVNPRDAVILTYRNNPFNHPSEIVVERFIERDIDVHRVDREGMIIFEYRFNKRIKRTPYSP